MTNDRSGKSMHMRIDDTDRKRQKHEKFRNVQQVNRIDSLVQLFDDTYEVYKMEVVMTLEKAKQNG